MGESTKGFYRSYLICLRIDLNCRLPLLGSLLHVPHVPGLLTNAAQWFIQRYGKLVPSPKIKIPQPKNVISDDTLQVGLYLGPYPAVVLYDYEDARDLFNQDVVSGRNFYHPSILERPISGRPDSFVYRFRMLGNKLG